MVRITVNGKSHQLDVEPDTPLLYALRDNLGLHGPKFGCGLAQCGSCTVLVDGRSVRSCVVPVSQVKGRVVTLEGLGTPEKPHPVQQAFIEEQAAQCGYCITGIIMAAKALLDRKPKPSDDDIDQALERHLCRCGTHNRIRRAIHKAARAGSNQ